MTYILIKDWHRGSKVIKKGTPIDVDREVERELKVKGIIDNDNIIIETAEQVMANIEKRTQQNIKTKNRRVK